VANPAGLFCVRMCTSYLLSILKFNSVCFVCDILVSQKIAKAAIARSCTSAECQLTELQSFIRKAQKQTNKSKYFYMNSFDR
jgi:hypothetical protein